MSTETTSPLLAVRGLTKVFRAWFAGQKRQTRAVDDVSFEVAAGERVALVGESGSGKSTIARLVCRLEPPDAGELMWRGGAVWPEQSGSVRAFRAGVQLIFQDPFAALNPVRRIHHHLLRPLRLHRPETVGKEDAQIAALLESVGLYPGAGIAARFPHELSGGQRQRVCIARALAVNPALIVADEPTSMLDASLRGELLALLGAVTGQPARALLYITHDLGAARAIAGRVLVLYAGKIVEAGPTADVLDAPAHPYTAALVGAIPDGTPWQPGPSGDAAAGAPLATPLDFAHACAYRDRCPRASERCHTELPQLVPIQKLLQQPTQQPNRLVRCHHPLANQDAPS